MSWGRVSGAPESSSARQVSTWSASSRLAPIVVALGGQEGEAHAAADDEAVGHLEQGARSRPSLSLTFDPPSTTTNGRRGSSRSGSSTSTSRASSRPAALGRNRGGPTIEAWARCEAPKASLT